MTDEDKDELAIYKRAVELINDNMQGNEAELINDKPIAIKTDAPAIHVGIAIAQAMSEHPELSIDDSWEISPPNEENARDGFKVYY